MKTNKMMAMVATAGLAASLAGSAHAQLVTNGGFETLTDKNGNAISTGGQMNYNTYASGWTTTGYNFIFTTGSADTTGETGSAGVVKLWGPGTGNANGLPATSPSGGNYVAADGNSGVAPITQTINGLSAGHAYAVSFDWAGAQQSNRTGSTTEQWIVKLGNDTQSTSIISLASHDFSGWKHQTFNYMATSSSEVLSFLAKGTPAGTPPFSLLDGVSVVATPEPSPLVSLFVGGLGLAVIIRLRARAKKSSS